MARTSLLQVLKGLLDGPGADVLEADPLGDVVRQHMPDASPDEQRLVTAIAGLLASVAFADAEYAPQEERHVREELGRIHGLSDAGADAVCAVLSTDIGAITAAGDQRWVRDLKQLTDHAQRLEVLEVLIDLAAADEEFSMAEQNYLRRLAAALGLPANAYVAAQARHKDKLSLLR